jgi:hypothetical protein
VSFPFRVAAAIDSAVRAQLTSPVVLERRLTALRGAGRWGAPKLDELLLDSGGCDAAYTYHQVLREPDHVIETMRQRLGHQIG